MRSCRFSGFDGSGWWFGNVPSTSQNISVTSQPRRRNSVGAKAPATPLPQSTAIVSGRARRMSPVMRSRYAGAMSAVRNVPAPEANWPASMRARSFWMSSPDSVVPSTTILRPL